MIAILLATYNSEKYLEIQLNSILAQTNKNWKLYIRDDGSSDKTIAIVKKYCGMFDNIAIVEDDVQHRGARDSFFYLLKNVDADYYMFCDHDDFWLPNKIEVSLKYMQEKEKANPNIPICLYTDAIVVDGSYRIVSKSLWKISKINPSLSEKMPFLLMFNSVTGCTMIINKMAKKTLLPISKNVPMHDVWIAYSVLKASGILFHLDKATLLYCQHGDNAVGANNVSMNYVKSKICSFKKVIATNKSIFNWINETYRINPWQFILYKMFYSVIRIF